MSKPEDIPQDVWDKALEAMHPEVRRYYATSPMVMVQHLSIARAIIAAEKRGEERERDESRVIIDWADRQVRKPYSVQLALDALRKRGE